jgi:hypothetical protein
VGDEDRGSIIQTDLIPPISTIERLTWPSQRQSQQQSITPGETLTLQGHHLDKPGTTAFVRFSNAYLSTPIEIALPSPVSANEITVNLPQNVDSIWVSGFYTVALRYERAGTNQFSNAQPLAIAPTIDPSSLRVGNNGLALQCSPPVRSGQSVALLIGSQEIALSRDPDDTEALTRLNFPLTTVQPGEYWMRLRVDGVDSHLVMRTLNGKLQFNPAYRVTVPEGRT